MSYIFGDYRVNWTYNSVTKETTCKISTKDDITIVEETVKLYYNDEYDRKEARKQSFRKAMNAILLGSLLSKRNRSMLWLYFNTFIKDYN